MNNKGEDEGKEDNDDNEGDDIFLLQSINLSVLCFLSYLLYFLLEARSNRKQIDQRLRRKELERGANSVRPRPS